MKPSSRNLGLELAALGLFLLSLLLFLTAGISTSLFLVSRQLPTEPQPRVPDVLLGSSEAWAGALAMIIPALALIAIAWGLRFLLIEEGEQDE